MSARHVALLRGVNVGRAKRVAMADLRALVAALGYGGVRTLLNSGNVVYDAPAAEPPAASAARIEAAIAERLGVRARVIALSAAELSAVLADDPFGALADDPSRLLVAVYAHAADRARLDALAARDWAPERLAVGARAAYLWCPDGISAGQLAELAMRALGEGATTRNRATLEKLHALAAG